MNKYMLIPVLCVAVAGCEASRRQSYDSDRSAELWARYNELDRREQHAFVRNLTADDLFAFTLAAIPAHAGEYFKGQEVDFTDLRVEETLGLMGGDDFEDWGQKRLADGKRLTASAMISLLEDSMLPPEWRSSFRGYIRIMFYANGDRPPSDAYQIGLTDQDINQLKAYLKRTSKGDPRRVH